MSDLDEYIERRKARDPEFSEEFESGYKRFRIGVALRQAREEADMTQEEVANQIGTHKSAISRIENHAEDIRLSTLEKYADALGLNLEIKLTSP